MPAQPAWPTLGAQQLPELMVRHPQRARDESRSNGVGPINIIDRQWGRSRVTTGDAGVDILSLVGYDASAGRGIYRLQLPGLRQIQDLASRWQMELGVRYVF